MAHKSNSWLPLVSRDAQAPSGRRQTNLPSSPCFFFLFMCGCTCLLVELSTCSFSPQPVRLSVLWAEGTSVVDRFAPAERQSRYPQGVHVLGFPQLFKEHIAPFLANCFVMVPPRSLELACAGTANSASHWPYPHVKELCTACKHCLSVTSSLGSTAQRISFGVEKNNGNLQLPYLSCIKVRAFLTQVLAWMARSSVCDTWFKVFCNKKLFKTLMENTEKAGHGLLS